MARKNVWMLAHPTKVTYKVSKDIKKQAEEKANNLIQSVLFYAISHWTVY